MLSSGFFLLFHFFFDMIPSLSFLFHPFFFFLGSSNSDRESERLTEGKGDRLRESNRDFERGIRDEIKEVERERFTGEKKCRGRMESRSLMGLRCPLPAKLSCEFR
jgi:hypothetical protein